MDPSYRSDCFPRRGIALSEICDFIPASYCLVPIAQCHDIGLCDGISA